MYKFVVLLFCAFAFVNCDDDSSSSEEKTIKEIADFLKTKLNSTLISDMIKLSEKAEAKCPDIEQKLDQAVEQVADCIDAVETGTDTLCGLIRKNFMKCSKPGRDAISSCLPEESKDLPLMSEKIILAIIDQACNSTVEQILELFNPCFMEKDFTSFPACTDIKSAFDAHRNKLPSKSLICEMLPKLKNCAKAHRDASCPNPVTKAAVINFHEAVEDATKDMCDAVNRV